MKKILFSVAIFAISLVSFSQVGINTKTPQGTLDVVSANSGVVVPRVANTGAVTAPVNGMIIYDLSSNCFKGYQNGAWSDCGFVNAPPPPTPTITSTTGKIWMDRNLGATRVATSATDHLAYGDLYQWGRKADGHEKITWNHGSDGYAVNGVTSNKADVPANNLFIVGTSASPPPHDWRVTHNDNLWNGVAAVNNPCPAGFRVPSNAEISAEFIAYNINNSAIAFSSPFKFTLPGRREYNSGSLYEEGSMGHYWSSSSSLDDYSTASFIRIDSYGTIAEDYDRAYGLSVRCIKD